jgi:hypothetical protein
MSPRAASPLARRARLLVAAAVALLLLGACTGRPPTPTSYGETTEKNFKNGCEDSAEDEGVSDPVEDCDCAYKAIVDTIPFDQFKAINSDLSEDPGPLPPKMRQILDDCFSSG